MTTDIIAALITFATGIAIAFVNYLLSKFMLCKHPDKYASATVIRQLVQVLYIVAVFFVGQKTEASVIFMLIGACLGITIPMFIFTAKLLKLNEKNKKKPGEEGAEADG